MGQIPGADVNCHSFLTSRGAIWFTPAETLTPFLMTITALQKSGGRTAKQRTSGAFETWEGNGKQFRGV